MRDKRSYILFGAIFVAVFGALGTLTYFQFQAYRRCRDEIAQLDREKQEAQHLIEEIPSLSKAAKVLSEQVEVYAEILPKEHEVRHDAFVETMDRFARETGLQILRADPFERAKPASPSKGAVEGKGDREAAPPFCEHRYLFELVGAFPNFLRFVNKIENWDRFLAVEEIEILPEGATKSSSPTMDEKDIEAAQKATKSIQLVVSTYTHKPKSHAIEADARR